MAGNVRLCYLDSGRREVILMRDVSGNLFIDNQGGRRCLFSSEVRALLLSGLVDCQLTLTACRHSFQWGSPCAEDNDSQREESPPGNCMSISMDGDVMSVRATGISRGAMLSP